MDHENMTPYHQPTVQDESEPPGPSSSPSSLELVLYRDPSLAAGSTYSDMKDDHSNLSGREYSNSLRQVIDTTNHLSLYPVDSVRSTFYEPQLAQTLSEGGRMVISARRNEVLNRLGGAIMFLITRQLTLDNVLNLYAMSKDFHSLANSRFAGMIRLIARKKAPESARVFLFSFYPSLCIPDPAYRRHPTHPGRIRLVPSFRWLRFLYHREKVIQEIMSYMDQEGVQVPRIASITLKKLWLLMDMNTDKSRIVYMRGRWSDQDLLFAQMFFLKLDMRFCDPIDGMGKNGVRRMLMAQKTMTILRDALAKRALNTSFDCLKMFVRWKWNARLENRHLSIFDIPPSEVGQIQYEGYNSYSGKLFTPIEDLVLKESCRRKLGFEKQLLDMMLWGYVDPYTGADIPRQNVPMTPWRLVDEFEADEEDTEGSFEKYVLREYNMKRDGQGGDLSAGEELDFMEMD